MEFNRVEWVNHKFPEGHMHNLEKTIVCSTSLFFCLIGIEGPLFKVRIEKKQFIVVSGLRTNEIYGKERPHICNGQPYRLTGHIYIVLPSASFNYLGFYLFLMCLFLKSKHYSLP